MDPTLLLIVAAVAVGVIVVVVVLPKLKKGETPAQAVSETETQAVGALHSVASQSLDNAKALGEALASHLAKSQPAPAAPAVAAPPAAPPVAPVVVIQAPPVQQPAPAAPAVVQEPALVAVAAATTPQATAYAPVGMSDRALYDLFIYGGAEGRAFGQAVVHTRFGVQDIGYTPLAAAWINKMEQAFPGGPMFNMVALMKRYNIGGTPSQPGALEPSGLAVYLQKRVQTTGLSMDSLLATFGLNASDSD